MSRASRFGSIALVFALLLNNGSGAPGQQSTSTSRQFIVYGTNVEIRGAICDVAEQTKSELLTLLGQRDDWTTAIVVNAQYRQANLPELPRVNVDLGQTGSGLRLQLNVVIDSAVNRPEIRREILRALMLEKMYRREPQLLPGATYAGPPDWLLDGIPSAQFDGAREKSAALLASPVATGNIWPLHKFLAQRVAHLDAATRNLYRAYSLALVNLLSRSGDGPRRLAQFILDLPHAPTDSIADLRDHFPEVFGTESAEVTWQKHLSQFSREQPYQLLGSAETERRLADLLRIKIPAAGARESYDLSEFPTFLKHKAAKNALLTLGLDLTALATRAHPVYAPIITEYLRMVAAIRRGNTLSVPKRLEELAVARRAMSARMSKIDDYLNWFEATNLPGPSGQFADYMKAAERATQPERGKKDPISIYLDALETQFEDATPSTR